MVKEGRVLRSYSGYYYVACGDTVYTCKVRGHMKKERFSLCTGDLVRFDAADVPSGEAAKGMIAEVLPRRNHLTRPTVANMDLNVITTSLADPDLSFLILDKLLVLAARGNMPCVIVLTKADLVSPGAAEQVAAVYRAIGYEVFPVSSRTGQGIDALRERLQGLITVAGGPSGVGKSSLLNALEPGTARQTGAVSRKIGRGVIRRVLRTWCRSMEAIWPIPPGSAMSFWTPWSRRNCRTISGNSPRMRISAVSGPAAIRTNRSAASRTPWLRGRLPGAVMRPIKRCGKN